MTRRNATTRLACALALALASAATTRGADAGDDPFVRVVARDRASVLAVGSFDPNPRDNSNISYFGTGFLLDDGTVLATNAHVVEAIRQAGRLAQLRVFLPDSPAVEGIKATLWAEDRFHDVALLKLDSAPAKPLELEVKDPPAQGQTVGVIGYPIGIALGVVPAVHKGVIAAVVPAVLPLPKGSLLTPELAEAIRRPYMLYQLDLVVYPGHSGSPLLDGRTGKVLGIVNKTLATHTREHLLDQPSAISYAVPVKWIDELLQRTKLSNTNPAGAGPPAAGRPEAGEK